MANEQFVVAAWNPTSVDLRRRLVNEMIAEARRLQASDIHIETNPGESLTLIRFRRDGDLEPYLRLPSRLRGPLVSRIKIMARLDIAERRRPQDGKIGN
jgi:type II secretory ATPase GspE/PulE/Tfp pilus assembly ATPase PilB-like protein